MDALFIPHSEDTPEINFCPQREIFEISYRSLPENAMEFYQPIFDWLEKYYLAPNDKTIIKFKLEYFNTSTAKQLAKFFLLLEKISTKSKVIIHWHYEQDDIDMFNSGTRYAKLIKLKFDFIAYE
jgi:hypothetical protein